MAKKKGKLNGNKYGKERISVYVTPELKKELVGYARNYGSSLTGMASMAIYTGLKTIAAALDAVEKDK